MRFGTVAIIGRTNVGKSTFLNAALGEDLAIVSPQPQTTREEMLGVVQLPDAQIAFTDTPGLHRPKTELGRRMNATALSSAKSHEVVVFVTDVTRFKTAKWRPDSDPIHPDDRKLIQVLREDVPTLLVLNKVDQLRNKQLLLPMISAFSELHSFAATIPTSMLRGEGVKLVLEQIVSHLPEQEVAFDPDTLTDKPLTFFVREFVREQVLLNTQREVPHAVAVSVDRFEENDKLCGISATIHVEKAGQRSILLGRGGSMIKTIGTAARERLEKLLDKKVYLELFVRITERWKDVPRQLQELGYDGQTGRGLTSVLPSIAKKRVQKKKATAQSSRSTSKEGSPPKGGDRVKAAPPRSKRPSKKKRSFKLKGSVAGSKPVPESALPQRGSRRGGKRTASSSTGRRGGKR